MEPYQSSVAQSSFLIFGLTLGLLSYTAISLHNSDVHHVYRRATAIPSRLFYVLQSELALRQLLRFALRYFPLPLQALLALLPFFRGGHLGSDHLLLSFNA